MSAHNLKGLFDSEEEEMLGALVRAREGPRKLGWFELITKSLFFGFWFGIGFWAAHLLIERLS